MAKEVPIEPEKRLETAKPETTTSGANIDSRANKLLEKQKLAASQGFSLSGDTGGEAVRNSANITGANKFQLVDAGQVVASAKVRDHSLIAEKSSSAKAQDIHSDAGVSEKRIAEVKHWWESVPSYIRDAATAKNIQLRIVVSVNQTPDMWREASLAARGHERTVDQLPMFYSPSLNAIVFVDKATRNAQEQKIENQVTNTEEIYKKNGVQNYGDGSNNLNNFDVKRLTFAGIERNGWHELGHAIDQAILQKFSNKASFTTAFDHGKATLNATEKKELEYFLNNKDELFAEIFAIEHLKPEQRTHRDSVITTHFSELIGVMKKSAQIKDNDGHTHQLF